MRRVVVLVLAQQPNERGPVVMKEGGRNRCFCCKKHIEPGQKYYYIPTSVYTQRRHVTCARKTHGQARDENPCSPPPQLPSKRRKMGKGWQGL